MGTPAELVAWSNRWGSVLRNTNFAGGNTPVKGFATDPVTGEGVELTWVKGSGGDLGTLTETGLAALRVDRLRALAVLTGAGLSHTTGLHIPVDASVSAAFLR